MKPRDIIQALKKGKPGTNGRLVLNQPITNIPVSDSDYQAAQVIEFILEKVLPEKATLQDILNILAEVQWWLVFFVALKDDRPFEPIQDDTEQATLKSCYFCSMPDGAHSDACPNHPGN